MSRADRRQAYAHLLGAPRWNHASAHCACDVDHPDGTGFTTTVCRRNYERAVRERDRRLDALLTLVDSEVAAARRTGAVRARLRSVALRPWPAPAAAVRSVGAGLLRARAGSRLSGLPAGAAR